MEQVLDSLWGLYNGFTGWTPPRETMATVVFFSVLASVLITYFTAGSRMFTVPICFIVLFVAAPAFVVWVLPFLRERKVKHQPEPSAKVAQA